MKKLLPLILVLLSFKNYSQSLMLTQAFNEPIVGDTGVAVIMDTTAFSNGLMTNVTGSNSVWNYQALTTTTAVIKSPYVSTTAVSNSGSYPGATFVQEQGGLNSFFKSATTPTTQTEFLGLSSTGISMNFTNTAIIAKYPMSYGTSISDPFSGSFTFSSTTGNASGTAVTNADGTGTLNLPGGFTFTNVLRVKSSQNVNLTVFGFPFASVKQLIYNFYEGSQKFPILSINYSTIQQGTSQPSVTAVVSAHNYYYVGLKENAPADEALSLYPNLSNDILHLLIADSFKPSSIEIYNMTGQCIYRGAYQNTTDVNTFQRGIYFIEIKTEKGIARKKFIKE